jgi:hypothetical protein
MRLWLWVRWDRGGTGGGDGMTIAVRDNTDKERVRDASDIVRVIGEVISLKAKGREYVCLCPFHDDHRPSMNVVPCQADLQVLCVRRGRGCVQLRAEVPPHGVPRGP